MDNGITSAIFLKKVGSGVHNDPERERDVISMPGKIGSGMPFWLVS
jgi:hypothetical protein